MTRVPSEGAARYGFGPLWAALLILALLGAVYAGAQVVQLALVSEGATPDVWEIPLPAGSEIVAGPEKECGSGGCWISITVRPTAGTTPEEAAASIGVTPQLVIPGDPLDWRSVEVRAEAGERTLTLHADFVSSAWVL